MATPSFDLTRGGASRLQGGSSGGSAQGSRVGPTGQHGVQPREWQNRLIQLLRARVVRPCTEGHDVLVHAGPGAGKTLGALMGFARLQQEGRLGRFVVFCHRSSIARQWLASASRLGLDLCEWGRGEAEPVGDGLLISYQAAGRHGARLQDALPRWLADDPWLAIADEVHHLGIDPDEPEATAWGNAFTTLTRTAELRLGLSGTPFRADNLAFCAARRVRVEEDGVVGERIVPDLCVEPRRLILAGDVRPLEFRFQDGWVEHGREREEGTREVSPLSAEERESWRARNLRRAIRLGDGSGIALRLLIQARLRLEKVRREHPGAGGLVIARDIAHARHLGRLLEEEGDRIHLVHSQDSSAAARLAAFREGEADWLVSVDMCAEGFDAPRLRVVAYLTTVVTRSRFVQAITRAVRMDGERSACEPIPRLPSYVYAPADPLLIGYARSWSLSEPYHLRPPAATEAGAAAGGGTADGKAPLVALADDAGAVIAMKGPELPPFVRRSA
ncbi:DEAD/DEAH box helicase family protein [Cyanobium sp. FGCU-52]|nr:DEAD/DEAH box helicase family protein [Cyanobium sp. FGCU52]